MINLHDLSQWDIVVMWGGGKDSQWFCNQFRCDYIVDKNSNNLECKRNIPIYPIDRLISDSKAKRTLIIVSSTKYLSEIKGEIAKLGIKADVTELNVMKSIYSHENVSYSLWGFDVLIKDLLVRGGYNISEMTYIEIGAAHPIIGSTTYNIFLRGAKGYLVEPNQSFCNVYNQYRDDKVIPKGIAKEKKKMPYYIFDNEYRNTFDKVVAVKTVDRGFKLMDTIDVEVENLECILEENSIKPETTVLSIQAMGLEYEILEKFDSHKYAFPMIALAYQDDNVFDLPIFSEYKIIAHVPRHIVLVNEIIYSRILI